MALSFWQKYGAQRATDRPIWGGAVVTFGCGHRDETRYDTKAYSPTEIAAWAVLTRCKDCRGLHRAPTPPLPRPETSRSGLCAGQDSKSHTHRLCRENGGTVRVSDRWGAPLEACACWCHR